MKSASRLSSDEEVLTTNDARQANGKTTSFRVLTTSLLLAALAGFLLVGYFWFVTPNAMDGVPAGNQTELNVPRDAPVAPLDAPPSANNPPVTEPTPNLEAPPSGPSTPPNSPNVPNPGSPTPGSPTP